jgi:hypothetical protein
MKKTNAYEEKYYETLLGRFWCREPNKDIKQDIIDVINKIYEDWFEDWANEWKD